MTHKFGSNLGFKTSGNSVISVNSTRGRHLTDGEPLSCSSRRRGHVRLRAGMEKAPAWLPFAFEPRYKTFVAVVLRRFSSSVFSTPPPLLRRAFTVDLAPLPSRQSLSQLHLFLAHPANQPWLPVFAENLLCALFFLAAGNISVVAAPSWPALYGELLTSGSIVSASPWCRGALCPVD